MKQTATIRRLDSKQADFADTLNHLLDRGMIEDPAVSQSVADILHQVRTRGDDAVLEYTRRFDRRDVSSMAELEVSREQMQAALDHLSPDLAHAL